MNRIVIIGTGMAGYNLAREIRKLDPVRPMTLITSDDGRFYPKPMLSSALALGKSPEQLATASAAEQQQSLKAEIRTHTRVTGIDSDNRLLETDQGPLSYEQLVLARKAGLEINRGIVTDRRLQTSRPGIYALGDCAEVAGLNLPFVQPIMLGARALAQTLTGTETRVSYPAMPVVIKTSLHPVIVSPPSRDAEGEWQSEQLDGGVRALFKTPDGTLLGFALTGTAATESRTLAGQLPALLA